MTCSLCFTCAHVKWDGIFVPCSNCGGTGTGFCELDMLFSDHHLSVSTLEGFGSVLRSIHRVVENPEVRLWAFMYHVSRHHPSLLRFDVPPSQEERFAAMLERAEPPVVIVEERG